MCELPQINIIPLKTHFLTYLFDNFSSECVVYERLELEYPKCPVKFNMYIYHIEELEETPDLKFSLTCGHIKYEFDEKYINTSHISMDRMFVSPPQIHVLKPWHLMCWYLETGPLSNWLEMRSWGWGPQKRIIIRNIIKFWFWNNGIITSQ